MTHITFNKESLLAFIGICIYSYIIYAGIPYRRTASMPDAESLHKVECAKTCTDSDRILDQFFYEESRQRYTCVCKVAP